MHKHIQVIPMTRDAIYLAQSYGLISFETMMEKLKEISEMEKVKEECERSAA